MTTFTAERAAADFPVFKPLGAGLLGFAYGVIEIAVNPVAADIYEMCRIPAGAVVVDGFVRADDLDTNATETLDMNMGWAANGAEAADPDGFGNYGVWIADGAAGVTPEIQIWMPFNGVLKDGPQTFTRETVLQVSAVVTAATSGLGTLYVGCYYLTP